MLSIIVAVDENNAIGKDNKLLWHIPKDLQRFKILTTGYPVIMGRKTFESIARPLPGRTNIVLSENPEFELNFKSPDCFKFQSFEQALEFADGISDNCFAIGGERVYSEALHSARRIYFTLIHHKYQDADTFFPKIDEKEWQIIEKEEYLTDDNFEFPFSFSLLEKLNKTL